MDPTTPPQAGPEPAQGTNAPGAPSDGQEPKQYDPEYVRKLRRDEAATRTRNKELETQLAAVEQARKDAEAAALAEQGKYKELYEAEKAKAAQEAAARAAAERRALVAQLAQEAGLPPALISRVQGDDEAAIKADIATLLPLVQPAPPPAPKPTSGLPTNGARPTGQPATPPVDLTRPPAWADIFSKPS